MPVHDVGDYLSACLDSVLGQPHACVDVVAVDDASADESAAILDARAAREPRLHVVRLPANSGPGQARNAGLAHATGDYVWFVDADDLVTDGALGAIGERLGRDRPDLLLIDYEYLDPAGRTEPSPGRAQFRAAPAGVFTLADCPQVVDLTMAPWAKVIRREFLAGLRLSFPPGIYEDVLLTCALLLGAARISMLDRVCYGYRRRPGSAMATQSSQHFDIFASYQKLFDFLSERIAAGDPRATAPVQSALFERAIGHYSSVLQSACPPAGRLRGGGGLIPRATRRRFFQRMHADFMRYRPAGYRPPPGARGVKFRLVERNAYRTYSVLEPVNQLRVQLSRVASRPRA
jgi:CDP-glycerol glycerophosphotransferase